MSKEYAATPWLFAIRVLFSNGMKRNGDRLFRLEFALLTYDNVEENRYAYKIEGIDKVN